MSSTEPVADEALSSESRTLRAADQLLRNVPGARSERMRLDELLRREAEALLVAWQARRPEAAYLLRGDKYRGGADDPTDEAIFNGRAPSFDEAFACMVRWHWWDDAAAFAAHAGAIVDPRFEAACDAIIDGDVDGLRALLTADPTLARARSRFAHHQTLLQHVAANGIENSRQWRSPKNAPALAQLLLDAGAEADAGCDSYGGSNTMGLLVTSAHPATAGVQGALVEVLCRGGANPNGTRDDGGPIWWATSNGYPDAVDGLVRCGARIDNLLYAAAAGDLDRVRSYFDDEGRTPPDRAYAWGQSTAPAQWQSDGRRLDPRQMVEHALHAAIGQKRRAVVEFLLARRPDLAMIDPVWNNSFLEIASYAGDPAILALIKPLFDDRGQPIAAAPPQ
jgi:hypothetical protein